MLTCCWQLPLQSKATARHPSGKGGIAACAYRHMLPVTSQRGVLHPFRTLTVRRNLARLCLQGGTAAKAFQRVKADEWLGKKGSWDNSYEGTFGQGGWGYKAQQILGAVRGK